MNNLAVKKADKIIAHSSVENCLFVALFACLGLAIYGHALPAPFQFDAAYGLIGDENITSFAKAFWYNNVFRRVTYFSYHINYRLGGFDPFGWRLLNFVIHIFNTSILFFWIKLIFKTPAMQKIGPDIARAAALMGALIFLVHPVQSQAVIYIYQRSLLLVVFFYLNALLFYSLYRRSMNYWFFAASFFIVLMSFFVKSISITLPIVILLYEVCFYPAKPAKNRLISVAPFCLIFFTIPLLLAYQMRDKFYLGMELYHRLYPTPSAMENVTVLQYVCTEIRVFCTYIRLMLLPVNQVVDYVYPLVMSVKETGFIVAASFLCALFGLGLYLWEKHRCLSFGIFWFYAVMSVELVHVRDLIFEHRIYLPMVGFSVAAGYFFCVYFKNSKLRNAVFFAVVVIFSCATYARGQVWQTEISFWQDVINKQPDNPRAHLNISSAYDTAGNLDKVLEHNFIALKLGPDVKRVMAYSNIGMVYLRQGKIQEGIEYCRKSNELSHDYSRHFFLLGYTFEMLGKPELAIPYYRRAMKTLDFPMESANNLGNLFIRMKRYPEAREVLLEGMKLPRDTAIIKRNLYVLSQHEAGNMIPANDSLRYGI